MSAEQFLALADTLRAFALHSGRDLNAANLFVHAMLMRAVKSEPVAPPEREAAQGGLAAERRRDDYRRGIGV